MDSKLNAQLSKSEKIIIPLLVIVVLSNAVIFAGGSKLQTWFGGLCLGLSISAYAVVRGLQKWNLKR